MYFIMGKRLSITDSMTTDQVTPDEVKQIVE